MEEVVDVPFGILGVPRPSKDETTAPADAESGPSTSFACFTSNHANSVSLPTVPVTTCMFQEQFEKEVKNMFFGKNADNKKANFKVVTREKMLRITNRLDKGIKAKESRSFKQYLRRANYIMVTFPDETAEVLCRTVKITETDGDETITTLVNRRVAAFEDFFQILSQIHVYENDHGGMQKTWKAVMEKYTMIPRSAVRKYIELCPECISKRAALAEKKPLVPTGSQPMVVRCKTARSPKRAEKRKLPHEDLNEAFKFSSSPSLEDIRRMQKKFISERDWDQFHAPRNVLLAMVGEVGEVAELFQWRGEVKVGLPGWSEQEKTHLGQELSDVLLYLIDLAERCHVDLPKAVVAKMALNASKYPADRVKGSSKKYTEYS